jgi:hypothetical protein
MARNPHRPGSSAAQSFRADEIDALDRILTAFARGANPRDLQRLVSLNVLGRLARKAAAMRASVERQKASGLTVIEGGKAR